MILLVVGAQSGNLMAGDCASHLVQHHVMEPCRSEWHHDESRHVRIRMIASESVNAVDDCCREQEIAPSIKGALESFDASNYIAAGLGQQRIHFRQKSRLRSGTPPRGEFTKKRGNRVEIAFH